MEHMKRMLVIAVAIILAGAGLMYVHRYMYQNCGDNVQVQSTLGYENPNQQGGKAYDKAHRNYEESSRRSVAQPEPM